MSTEVKKPLVFYVDDEPRNLAVFEASFDDDLEIVTFDSPVQALKALDDQAPWVIVSDQRMPAMSGVEYLELSKKIHPDAVRMIVTGYSDENLVIDSVRKAQIFDYVQKPWNPDDLENSVLRAIDFFKMTQERNNLIERLKLREKELVEKTETLETTMIKLQNAHLNQKNIAEELQCWVPPFVLESLHSEQSFPRKEDIVGLTMDIISSADIHGLMIRNKNVRSIIIQQFSEAVLRHGGWRESHSGDSAYAHFGIMQKDMNPFEASLAAAHDFRVSLIGMNRINNLSVNCGIALNVAKNAELSIHKIQYHAPQGSITQKSVDTTCLDIDILHRIEKLVHSLPGSNIVLTKDFVTGLEHQPDGMIDVGSIAIKGSPEDVHIYLLPSEQVSLVDVDKFVSDLQQLSISKKAA